MDRLRSLIDVSLINNKAVLDIGTGPKSVSFLVSCGAKSIVGLTHNESEINESKEISTGTTSVDFIVADLPAEILPIKESFDVIFAGYFMSALEGTKPGQLQAVLNRIRNYLKDDGIIIVEDFYWQRELSKEQDKLGMELYELAYRIKDLVGETYPKQMPETKAKSILESAGYKVIQIKNGAFSSSEVFNIKPLQKRADGILRRAKELNSDEAGQLSKRAKEIIGRLKQIKKNPDYFYDYLIFAKKS